MEEDAGRILNFWEAIETVWPLPDTWQQTALVCHQLSRGLAVSAAVAGKTLEIEPPDSFMPARWKPRSKTAIAPRQSATDQVATLDSIFKGRA